MTSGKSRRNQFLYSNSHLLIAIIINISIPFSLTVVTRLNNGNFLVFSSERTFVYDPTYTYASKYSGKVSYETNYENIAHFSEEDNGYIIYISYVSHNIFFSDGTFYNSYNQVLSKFYYDYSVIPYKDSYYFYVYYDIIKIIFILINIKLQEMEFHKEFLFINIIQIITINLLLAN